MEEWENDGRKRERERPEREREKRGFVSILGIVELR